VPAQPALVGEVVKIAVQQGMPTFELPIPCVRVSAHSLAASR
jgi:hypothetical protein